MKKSKITLSIQGDSVNDVIYAYTGDSTKAETIWCHLANQLLTDNAFEIVDPAMNNVRAQLKDKKGVKS